MIFKENGIFTKNIIASILKTKEFKRYRKKIIRGRRKNGGNIKKTYRIFNRENCTEAHLEKIGARV